MLVSVQKWQVRHPLLSFVPRLVKVFPSFLLPLREHLKTRIGVSLYHLLLVLCGHTVFLERSTRGYAFQLITQIGAQSHYNYTQTLRYLL